MTPTLLGRIQTRLVLLLTIGLGWTLIVTPFLPTADVPLIEVYRTTIGALVIVAVVGSCVWEPIYHGLQQFRWEKDWPTGLGLLTGVTEGFSAFFILSLMRSVPGTAFTLHFATTWLLVWMSAHGPLRIVTLRWRYNGGRFI